MHDNIETLTDSTFDETIAAADTPVLVDFWAEWCGPCRAMEPILDELAEEWDGRVQIAKLNVDENPEISARYGVMSIPTMILFVDGEAVERIVGARPKAALADAVGNQLTSR